MFLFRSGFPEESDLVMCTVTNIQHNSIFVGIHEYDRQGMITISEVAPGRIRNIRDYVAEGKVIVCKVLNVNKERGYIDLSLRRVTEGQRRTKSDELKQELRAEKIIEMTAHVLKQDPKVVYATIAEKLLNNYFYLYQAFDDFLAGNLEFTGLFDKTLVDLLEKTIREKIKPKEIIVAGDFTLSSWEETGLETVKEALLLTRKYPQSTISYLGGGRYRLIVRGIDYKNLEKILKDASEEVINYVKKHKGKAEYVRVKNISSETAAA